MSTNLLINIAVFLVVEPGQTFAGGSGSYSRHYHQEFYSINLLCGTSAPAAALVQSPLLKGQLSFTSTVIIL